MLPGYLPAAGCPRDRVALAAVDGQTGVRRQEGNAMTVRLRRLQHFNFITGGSHHLSLSHLCVRWKPLKTSSTLRFLPPPPFLNCISAVHGDALLSYLTDILSSWAFKSKGAKGKQRCAGPEGAPAECPRQHAGSTLSPRLSPQTREAPLSQHRCPAPPR